VNKIRDRTRYTREAFALLQARCPDEVSFERWSQVINDGGRFLDDWGDEAERRGWPASELFDMDANAPLPRYGRTGLCWLLQGKLVTVINEKAATLGGGLSSIAASDSNEPRL
jgi:hypothetical protein